MTAPSLSMLMTSAGLARFAAAQADHSVDLTIAQIGLTAANFVAAPTLTNLPGEFRRLSVSGEVGQGGSFHLVALDEGATTYQLHGIGIYLADGTLFAVYSQADAIVEKSAASAFALAFDVGFPAATGGTFTFGPTNFLFPAATTDRRGVVELATLAETLAGTDATRAVTPADLGAALPVGVVLMWSGAAASVPGGWAICDGRQVDRSDGTGKITTPDLRDRVPVGASTTHAQGSTFGDTSKTVSTAASGAHTPSGKMPAHTHDVTIDGATGSSTTGVTPVLTKGQADAGSNANYVGNVTLNDPGHTHAVHLTATTTSTGPTALQMDAVPAHQHGVTIDVTQPSLALHFIMRV